MRRDAVARITGDPPARARRPDHLWRQGGRPTLIPCRPLALWDVGDKARAVARVTHRDPPGHRGGLYRLTPPGQQRPRPLLAPQALGHVVAMVPRTGLWLPAAPRRAQGQRRVVPPRAPRRREDPQGAALEKAVTAPAADVIHPPHAPAHARPQHRWRPLRKRGPESRRHGQADMTVHDALVAHPAHLVAPGGDRDCGAAQAQGCLTAHGDPLGALSTMQPPVCARAHLLGGTTGKPLGDEAILIRAIVPRMDAWKSVSHPLNPLYHRPSPRHAHPPLLPLSHGDFRAAEKCKFLCYKKGRRNQIQRTFEHTRWPNLSKQAMKSGRSTWSNGKNAYLMSVRDVVWARRKCLPCRNFGLR